MNWSTDFSPPISLDLKKNVRDHNWKPDKPLYLEKELLRKDGGIVPVEIKLHALCDSNGKPAFIYGFITDLTGRKISEKYIYALANTEKKYRQIVETANEGIWMIDANGDTIFANRKIAEMLGYPYEEFLKANAYDCIYSDDKDKAVEMVGQALSHGLERFEFKYKHKDGKTIWMQESITPMYDHNDSFTGILAMLTDITERKQAEKTIIESKAFMDNLFQSINLPIFVVDIERDDYRIIDVNPAFEKNAKINMGLTKELCAGLTLGEIEKRVSLPAGAFNMMRENFDKCIKKGKPIQYETHDRSTGECWFMSLTPLRDENGMLHRIVGNLMNITKIKQAEKELIEARGQSELYLDLMGHDINNMHQVALGYLELISAGGLDEDTRELLKKPYEALQKSSKIIDNVRKLQKIKAGDVKKAVIDVERLLKETVNNYQGIQGKTITLKTGEGTGYKINANDLLHDVFDNLIGNAIKHTSGKDVVITVTLDETWVRNKPYVRVAVEDNGPGIPNKAKRNIFNRMQRGETKASGMGLGLYLARSLVESYNGRIWVEDREEGDHKKGSRFVVIIPKVKEYKKISGSGHWSEAEDALV